MKKTYILLTLCLALIACTQNSVDFSYSPEAPKAGESVRFSNLSSSGEEWEWTFGDGGTSTLKSPSHTYKKPGTYRVILKVDNRATWTATKELTVYDTVPSFACEDSVFYVFKDYTFTANVYNPYNYEVEYQWSFPLDMVYCGWSDTAQTFTGSSITLYFTKAMTEAPVDLRVIMNGDTTYIEKTFLVQDRATNSILIRTPEGDYRQRIFADRAEQPKADASAKALLDAEQDTMQTYNGYDFRLSELQTIFPELQGFHIINRKIYYRANGLWVANIDGAYQVQIDAADCFAMTLDTEDSRICWANENGVWYLPFIGSDNNKFVTTPVLLNSMTNVTKLAADSEPK